ncbi:MAG: repair protein RadC [Bacteroidetes bacterium]|nr:repair protein RadC [Bacteroidota bacterium]
MNIKLTEAQKIKVLNSADIYKITQQILLRENKIDRNKEHFWLVCLSNQNKILMIELISLGSANMTVVEPMDVFSFALQKRAVRLIMVHNHPGGELEPSTEDIKLTERIMAIGKFIRVPIMDHLIITEKSYTSFDDMGLIEKIETDNNYDLTFKQVDALKREMKNLEKKSKAEVTKKMNDLAKKLIAKKKFTNEEVAELTGLTVKQVEGLMKN